MLFFFFSLSVALHDVFTHFLGVNVTLWTCIFIIFIILIWLIISTGVCQKKKKKKKKKIWRPSCCSVKIKIQSPKKDQESKCKAMMSESVGQMWNIYFCICILYLRLRNVLCLWMFSRTTSCWFFLFLFLRLVVKIVIIIIQHKQ